MSIAGYAIEKEIEIERLQERRRIKREKSNALALAIPNVSNMGEANMQITQKFQKAFFYLSETWNF